MPRAELGDTRVEDTQQDACELDVLHTCDVAVGEVPDLGEDFAGREVWFADVDRVEARG